jgi:putative nucleotidyltransferase with HDIG domain
MSEALTSARWRDAGAPLLTRLRAAAGLPLGAWVYWLGAELAACTLIAAALPSLRASSGWGTFAALTGAASLAQLSAARLNRGRAFHPALIFVIAGVLLLPPEQIPLLYIASHIADWLKLRYAWYIQPFNIANYIVAGSSAWYATAALGGFDGDAERMAAVGIAAVAVFMLVNRTLLAGMLWLARRLTPRESRLFAPEDVGLELVFALIAVTSSALYLQSPILGVLSLAPVALVYIAQRALHRLEDASQTIQQHVEELAETNTELIARSTAALEALSATVDARDRYTAGHSRSVREISFALGLELGLELDALEHLSQAALLHDIGKIGVPDSVLRKPGALSQNEWQLMRAHPEEGARIIARLGFLDEVVPAVRHHHERADGRGYPDGLIGDDIPLAARIIHVADSLDAMLTRRVYRDALSLDQALAEIRRGRGTDFCPECVDALERALAAGRLPFRAEQLELCA